MRYTDMDRDGDEQQQKKWRDENPEEASVENMMWWDNPMLRLTPQEAEPKRSEKELVVVALHKHECLIVWCNDGLIQEEIGNVGVSEVSSYIVDNKAPDHGIWVWEGQVRYSGPDYNGEYDGPECCTLCWRKPTEEEWEAIMEQRNPFEPKPKEDQDWGNWGKKTVL